MLLSTVVIAQQDNSSTPEQCNNTVVVTGYWPPTNEMLRHLSANSQQNPGGWQGENWRNTGYNVYAYFPEFPPDGDPTNDAIGEPGSVGAMDADFQVDYQDTSADFWRIMDRHQPRILITTSRGGDIGWELEAVEGGHGQASEWTSDRWGQVTHPLAGSIDPRSTTMVERHATHRLRSALPLALIKQQTAAMKLTDVAIDDNTSGSYLSGFMGLHGLFYHQTHLHNVAAGHVHVGRHVSVYDARRLLETTLATVLQVHPLVTNCGQPGD